MAKPFNMISGDAQHALTVFSEEFDAAFTLADVEVWAEKWGLVNSSRNIRTVYPIPISAAGYKVRKGEDKMRSLYERSLSMKPVEWQDGIEEKASIIEAPDFIGWAGEPARMAAEAKRHPNVLVAALLEANANLSFYKDEDLGVDLGIPLFSDVHPVNIFDSSFDTFDNDLTASAIGGALIKTLRQHFRGILGPNGRPMGLQLTDILAPAAREEELRDLLESDLLLNELALDGGANTNLASNNRFKGAVNLTISDELTNPDLIYPIAGNKSVWPWVVQNGGSPEEIRYDKDSDHYKDTGKVGVKEILLAAAAGALPHGIARVEITG